MSNLTVKRGRKILNKAREDIDWVRDAIAAIQRTFAQRPLMKANDNIWSP